MKKDEMIKDVDKNVKLTPEQLKLNKLAALFLFTSRGITMISEGQEFARSKVIPFNEPEQDPRKGMIDDNSYDKDNETNYINYHHAEINKDLLDYYRGLISLRKNFEAFRRAKYQDVSFIDLKDRPFSLGYFLKYKNNEFIVLLNADPKLSLEVNLPEGNWDVLVDENSAGTTPLETVKGQLSINTSTGIVLMKKRR